MDVQLIKRSSIIKPANKCDRQVKLLKGLVQNFSAVKMSPQPAAILLLLFIGIFATYSSLRFNNFEYKPPKFRHFPPAILVFLPTTAKHFDQAEILGCKVQNYPRLARLFPKYHFLFSRLKVIRQIKTSTEMQEASFSHVFFFFCTVNLQKPQGNDFFPHRQDLHL